MLKKISVSVLALAVVGFAAPAMAVDPGDPLSPVEVPITVTVLQMTEMWTNEANVPLTISDAYLNQGSTNAVTRTVFHLHNVAVDVSASINANIPDNTQFHILVGVTNPVWTTYGAGSGATKTLSWRREGGVYEPSATGSYPNQVTLGGGVGDAEIAFSAASNAGFNSGDPEAQMTVQYFADAQNIMPVAGTNAPFDVVWTIAAQ